LSHCIDVIDAPKVSIRGSGWINGDAKGLALQSAQGGITANAAASGYANAIFAIKKRLVESAYRAANCYNVCYLQNSCGDSGLGILLKAKPWIQVK
jgi:hypothetical protein